MVGFLPRLSHTLGNASLVLLKHAAIACLDTIVEKYGKRDTEGAVAAVHIVAGSDGLGHSDQRVQIISLLCLTSAVETLGPETIPLLPGALSIALQHLETSLAGGNEMTNLHNAVFSFLSALIVHVPWILTANHLDRIMSLSHKSAEAGLDESANQNRLHVLRLIVRQVAAQELFAVIKRTMTDAITVGPMVCMNRFYSFWATLLIITIGYGRASRHSPDRRRKAPKVYHHQACTGSCGHITRSI